jgi:hypothetical protein
MFKWVPCHRGMVRPRVADAGHGLQILRVAANIRVLIKQSRITDKGVSSRFGVGLEANNNSPQESNFVTKRHKGPRTWTDSLDKRLRPRKTDILDKYDGIVWIGSNWLRRGTSGRLL